MVPVAMRWRHVLFENYAVEPATVAARLPDALAVDTGTSTLFGANGFETPDGEPVVYYGSELAVTATASRRWQDGTDG
jgi:hypothetical protein